MDLEESRNNPVSDVVLNLQDVRALVKLLTSLHQQIRMTPGK